MTLAPTPPPVGNRQRRFRPMKRAPWLGKITTAEYEADALREKCRRGTQKYREALIAAGFLKEGA